MLAHLSFDTFDNELSPTRDQNGRIVLECTEPRRSGWVRIPDVCGGSTRLFLSSSFRSSSSYLCTVRTYQDPLQREAQGFDGPFMVDMRHLGTGCRDLLGCVSLFSETKTPNFFLIFFNFLFSYFSSFLSPPLPNVPFGIVSQTPRLPDSQVTLRFFRREERGSAQTLHFTDRGTYQPSVRPDLNVRCP